MKIPGAERSYIVVTNQYTNGDPFGYVGGNEFVLMGPAEGYAYLCDSSGIITSVDQVITDATQEEIITQVAAIYPAVSNVRYETAVFSVGDRINIGGSV